MTKVNGLGIGALGLIAAGLDFKNGWRAELEGSYRHNSGARFNVQAEGSTSLGVDRTTYAMMANLWRDFALVDRLDLHVGGGFGIAEARDERHQYLRRQQFDQPGRRCVIRLASALTSL